MKGLWVVAAFVFGLLSCSAWAQGMNQPWDEYDKLIKQKGEVGTLGPTLFGDQVSYYSGGLSFSATDVSVPGNNNLPVAITRTYNVGKRNKNQNDAPMADWDLDLPRLEGVFAPTWVSGASGTPNTRCSITDVGIARPPYIPATGMTYRPEDYWQGVQMHVPGGGGELLLAKAGVDKPTTGGPYYWVTSDFTYLGCLPTVKNMIGMGEGFFAITADGTKYWFDYMAQYYEPQLGDGSAGGNQLSRKRNVLYATRVEDRFGNWVTYAYTNVYTAPAILKNIDSSDGRHLTLVYNAAGHVESVDDGNGHIWTYQYAYPSTFKHTLTTVIQPDLNRWTIDFAAFNTAPLFYYKGEPGFPERSCTDPGTVVNPTIPSGTITHPSGAVGVFTVTPTRFGRSNVPVVCDTSGTPFDESDDVSYYPIAWDSFALTKKRVTGPGLAPAEWNYAYFLDSTVEITGPDSDFIRYSFGNGYRSDEGKLLKVERGTGPTDIRKTDVTNYEFALSGQPYPTPIGIGAQPRGDAFTSEYLRPQKSSTTTQDSATFSATVTGFDKFARPLSVIKASSGLGVAYSRTDATTYHDNLSKWVLGQVATVTCTAPLSCADMVMSKTDYDAYAMPWKIYAFDKLQQTLTYTTTLGTQAGTLSTVTDANSKVTTLSSWYRGVPRTVTYPATIDQPTPVTQLATVDDNGWITSVTDENGYATGYGYDLMGRLASIVYPTGDTPAWANTTMAFVAVSSSEYGIGAGHWKQTVSTGNARKVTYFDALWRPLVTETYDNAAPTTTRSVTVTRYNLGGQPAYQSYPLATLTSYVTPTIGTRTFYDPLDRVTDVEQDAEPGVVMAVTSTRYLPGFKTEVKTANGQATGAVTTTSYMAYDQPSTDWPVAVTYPGDAYTNITRDAFGKPTSLLRHNLADTTWNKQYYAYDADQRLCKHTLVENGVGVSGGTTAMGYDNAGNLTWSAAGLPWSPAAPCGYTSTSPEVVARRVDRTYDARNRLKTLRFPDHRGDQDWQYTPDSLPSLVQTVNDPTFNNPTNTYGYTAVACSLPKCWPCRPGTPGRSATRTTPTPASRVSIIRARTTSTTPPTPSVSRPRRATWLPAAPPMPAA